MYYQVKLCIGAICVLAALQVEALGLLHSHSPLPEAEHQQTRAEEIRAEREKRLVQVTPAKRNRVMEIFATFENQGFDQFFTVQLDRFLLGFGKISPLSNFTPGIGYEYPQLGGSPLSFRLGGAYSITGYQAYVTQFGVFDEIAPYSLGGSGFLGAPFDFDQRKTSRLEKFLYGEIRYNNFPREEFYGVGQDSQKGARSDYRLEQGFVDLVAGYQPLRWLGVEARAGYLPTHVGRGTHSGLSDVQDVFDEETAPGLGTPSDFLRFDSGIFVGWLGDPYQPSAQLGFRLAHFDDLDDNGFDFNRFSVDARGYLTLGCRGRILAVRGYVSRDFGGGAKTTPFFLMETLGGEETLRGFRTGRFRDSNLLYLSSEYRWEANAAVELAFFYDTGKVFPDRGGFTFDHLQHGYGLGIRAKNMRRVVFRLDVGHSQEGTFLYVTFGPSF